MSTAIPASSRPAPPYPWLPIGKLVALTAALGLGVFMNVLDASIANVSIPTISGDLAVSADNGTFIITSFAVANAVSVPISGWLARRFGEVRLFVVCTLLFTLFSFTCGISPTFPLLLLSRALQGAAAGPMIPISLSLLLSNYPQHRQGFANGIWGMTAVVGPVAGPVLGGVITDNIRWNWIFFINVPFGLVCAAVTWWVLKDRETQISRRTVDFIGLALLIVGLFCLQIMLDKGNDDAWFQSNFIVTMALIAAFALTLFVAWEATERHPLVELRLFRNRNFTIAAITMTFGYMAYFGGVVVLPLWLQTALPNTYNPTWAGYATASIGILGIVASPLAGRLADRYDVRFLVSIGLLIFAAVSFSVAFANTDINFGKIFWYRVPWGLGMPFFFIPLTVLSFRGVAPEDMAAAASLFNFVRLVALSAGTSISVGLWDAREAFHAQTLSSLVTASAPELQRYMEHATALGLSVEQAWTILAQQIKNQAFMISLNELYWAIGWMFLVLTLTVWFSRPGSPGSARH